MKSCLKEIYAVLRAIGVFVWGSVLALAAVALLAIIPPREAQAQVVPVGIVGYLNNQGGGRIELFNAPAPESTISIAPACKDSLVAKSWSVNSEDTFGCWKVMGDTVTIQWFAGTQLVNKTYLLREFTPTRASKHR
jgi:hypothetical protein